MLSAGAPVQAQYTGGVGQAMNDSAQINLLKAQTQALQAYVGCVQTASAMSPCQPPRPVQATSTQVQPSPNRGGLSQAMLDSARRDLMEAQTRALNAYAQCLKTKPTGACGPPP
jgi:hypothetical protein